MLEICAIFLLLVSRAMGQEGGSCVEAACFSGDEGGVAKIGSRILTAVDPANGRIVRACSCASHCALYGDCCRDSLEFSRRQLGRILNIDGDSAALAERLEQFRSLLRPKCREVNIGRQSEDDTKADSFITVQLAAECDACFGDIEDITQYFGTNSSEVVQRLPVYHEGLGIVFSNIHCARCYEGKLDMSRIRPVPLAARCNSSVNLVEDKPTNATIDGEQAPLCQYSLNVSQLFPLAKLAFCLPMVDDEVAQEDFACSGLDAKERNFKSCSYDQPVANVLQDKDGLAYKICPNQTNDLCGQKALDKVDIATLEQKCIKQGTILKPQSVRTLSDAQSFIHQMQRSDFSYRYMFDLQKLVTAEQVLDRRAGICRGAPKEIFIERWKICVRRNAGDITIGIVASSSSSSSSYSEPSSPAIYTSISSDWLDFSDSVYTVEQQRTSNGTLNVVKLTNNKNFQLESECFRWVIYTSQFLVSHRCLCEIFRQTETVANIASDEPPSGQSVIPRDDDILSLVGSISIWVSLCCLLAVIIILGLFPKLRNRPAKLVMLLSMCLCVGMSMVLVNIYANVSIIRPRHQQEPTYEEDCLRSPTWKEAACNFVGTTLHFSYLASFALASSLYIDLWRSVKKSNVPGLVGESQARFYLLAGTSLAIPLVIVLTAIVIDQAAPESDFAPRYAEFVCWISTPTALFAFFVFPVVVALVVDIVFFVLIARQIRANTFRPMTVVDKQAASSSSGAIKDEATKKRRREEKRKKHLRRLGIYARMALMMGLTWLIGCVAPFVPDSYGFGIALWYGFVVLNGLQGVFIFYTYVVNKKTWQVIRESAQSNSLNSTQRHPQTVKTPAKKSASDPARLGKR